MRRAAYAVAIVALAAVGQVETRTAEGGSGIDYKTYSVRTLRPIPGQTVQMSGWTRDGTRVVLNVLQDPRNGGLDSIYTADQDDGSDVRCVTCELGRSFRRVSAAESPFAITPDGQWMAVHGLGPVLAAGEENGFPDVGGGGFGGLGQVMDASVWVLRLRGDLTADAAYRLTSGTSDESDLRPVFTPDGRKVIWWANRGAVGRDPVSEAKHWQIRMADFVVAPDGSPHLSNEEVLVQDGGAFVEDGGVSGDGRFYYYTSTAPNSGNGEMYRIDIETREKTRLTFDSGWDEFPMPSPNGEKAFFISNRVRGSAFPWDESSYFGIPSDLDYLSVVPGSIVAGALGFGRLDMHDGQPRVRTVGNLDGFLMDADDGQNVIRITPDGGSAQGTWRPDSRELGCCEQAFDTAPDELVILHFGG